MFKCSVCNKEYKTLPAFSKHCYSSSDLIHEELIFNYYKELLENKYPNIKVKSICNRTKKGFKIKFINLSCNHECIIDYGHILNRGQLCNHPDCKQIKKKEVFNRPEIKNKCKQNLLKANKILWSTQEYYEKRNSTFRNTVSSEDYKNKMSMTQRNRLKTLNNREKLLNGIKKGQILKSSLDELQAIEFFKSHNIKYEWQVPLLLKEQLGYDFVIDFYLPEYNIYININNNVHTLLEHEKRDKLLQNYLGNQLVQIYYDFRDVNCKSIDYQLKTILEVK